MNEEYMEIEGYISEVKFQKETNKIFLALDVNGERKTVEITSDQLIRFNVDPSTKSSIMLKFYEAWKVRKEKGLPVKLQLTKAQMNGEADVQDRSVWG